MKEFVEKLIGRLEELGWVFADYYPDGTAINRKRKKSVAYDDVIEIVNQLAEEMGVSKMENTNWIPCEVELPKYTGEYNVTVVVASELGSFEEVTTIRFENIKGKEPRWVIPKDEIYRVIAWQPLPEPYQKGE